MGAYISPHIKTKINEQTGDVRIPDMIQALSGQWRTGSGMWKVPTFSCSSSLMKSEDQTISNLSSEATLASGQIPLQNGVGSPTQEPAVCLTSCWNHFNIALCNFQREVRVDSSRDEQAQLAFNAWPLIVFGCICLISQYRNFVLLRMFFPCDSLSRTTRFDHSAATMVKMESTVWIPFTACLFLVCFACSSGLCISC